MSSAKVQNVILKSRELADRLGGSGNNSTCLFWSYAPTTAAGRFSANPAGPFKLFSARAAHSFIQARFALGDFLLFGSETKGLGQTILGAIGPAFRIPIFEAGVRTLNLSNAVSIVVYEALRQFGRLDS